MTSLPLALIAYDTRTGVLATGSQAVAFDIFRFEDGLVTRCPQPEHVRRHPAALRSQWSQRDRRGD